LQGMSSESREVQEDLFRMAGLSKNVFLDQWEFFFSCRKVDEKVEKKEVSEKVGEKVSEKVSEKAEEEDEESESEYVRRSRAGSAMSDTPECVKADDVSIDAYSIQLKRRKKYDKKKAKKAAAKVRHVHWGSAEQILFSRSVGYDRIPGKGAYPIGLGIELERITCSIDELFQQQQRSLTRAAREKGIEVVYPPLDSGAAGKLAAASAAAGGNGIKAVREHVSEAEHEQREHGADSPKRTKKNHSQRKRSNSTTSVGSTDDNNPGHHITASISHLGQYCIETRQFDYKKGSNPLFHSISEDERIVMLTTKVDLSNVDHSSANPFTDANNEIKLVRASRDEAGCSCKPTKLDKLSVVKMRTELLNHGYRIGFAGSAEQVEQMSKVDLSCMVREVLKNCFLCVANDCHCVQMGIQCNAQLCGCMRGGHRAGVGQNCDNPDGRTIYDPEVVKKHRDEVLLEANKQL